MEAYTILMTYLLKFSKEIETDYLILANLAFCPFKKRFFSRF